MLRLKGLEPESMFPEEFYRRARNRYFAWLGVAAAVAVAGTVVLGVGLWKRRGRQEALPGCGAPI
jgi:hypothetical protein